MVSETEEVVMHKALIDAFGISEDYVYNEAQRKYEEEVLTYIYKYRKGRELVSLKGKYVILVDECIETGLTMMVALKSVIAQEAKNIYIATPILDEASHESLTQISDGVFCPHQIRDYISIEYYYENLERPAFSELERILKHYE
jgi:putative phosphoribosyl transferase